MAIWRLLVSGRLIERAGWTVPAFDAPLIALAQYIQTARLNYESLGIDNHADAAMMINSCMVMMGLLVLTTLSLSAAAIATTAVTALVTILLRANALGVSGAPLIIATIVLLSTTAVLLALVGRMRGLVHTSRAQDLLGKYVLGRKVGMGGMAEVFEATYSPEGGFERRVAVKRIVPNFADDPVALALFRQEAEVGAMLAHPGIVQVLDFGTHQGVSFLAMEFIDGVSLKDLITYQRSVGERLPISLITHITWQLAEALDYIHTRISNTGRVLNLVHRDLNPPNIMLTSIGDAKLADFGIALISGQERMTRAGVMRGKLGYAAPEQVLGMTYDGRADLFALGLTLHEALVGNRVFRADSEMELMKQVLEAPIPAPSVLRPDVPPALDAVVMGLLERGLERRTASANELRRQLLALPRELLDVSNGRKVLASFVDKAREWAASRPAEATATAVSQSGTDATSTSTVAVKSE